MTTETVKDTFQLEVDIESGYFDVEVEAHSKCYYHPGRTSGPPEQCYPAESDQETTVEITSITDAAGEPVPKTPELLAALEAALPLEWIEETLWAQFLRGDV